MKFYIVKRKKDNVWLKGGGVFVIGRELAKRYKTAGHAKSAIHMAIYRDWDLYKTPRAEREAEVARRKREDYEIATLEEVVDNERESRFVQALGLLTTLRPNMEINVDDPVKMAEEIYRYTKGLETACRNFVEKVWRGEAKSVQSYNEMKKALEG